MFPNYLLGSPIMAMVWSSTKDQGHFLQRPYNNHYKVFGITTTLSLSCLSCL